MRKEALIMTSTFTLIFPLRTKVTRGISLYFGNHVGVKGTKPRKNIFRATNGVGFIYVTEVSEGQDSPAFYNCGSPSCSHFGVEN